MEGSRFVARGYDSTASRVFARKDMKAASAGTLRCVISRCLFGAFAILSFVETFTEENGFVERGYGSTTPVDFSRKGIKALHRGA